ncbi:MAG: dehydratase [Planctomycetes bacterium SCN 63-9]|nr:MAG: dehydratase [Planctomycetes bacterium SCN 63-9]
MSESQPEPASLYYEDLAVGQVFRTGTVAVDEEAMIAFASKYDPQPFHLNEEAGRESLFGGLVASGWYTASLAMRLFVDGELRIVGGLIGLGIEELRWPRPVVAGDVIRVEMEVVRLRPSQSRPDRGILQLRNTTLNQHDQTVMTQLVNMIVPRRPLQKIVPLRPLRGPQPRS